MWAIIKRSCFFALWLAILVFPMVTIQVSNPESPPVWHWYRLLGIFVLTVICTALWQYLGTRKAQNILQKYKNKLHSKQKTFRSSISKKTTIIIISILALFAILYPFVVSLYLIRIMITALIFLILALGLNVMVGLGGLLNLGYAAFFAIGAYTYGLLHHYLGVTFWLALPVSTISAGIFGIAIAIPVLKLRGDYLAIITLAAGEIVRIVLLNWGGFTNGPRGIANIPAPGFFGLDFNLLQRNQYTYFVVIAILLFLIFIVHRLENSRIGRSWEATREDAIAAEAMGINIAFTKITIFAISSCIAGVAGALFAAGVNYINPSSFTVMHSVIILCIVVIGGMGSTAGAIVGTVILILLPEYLRFLSNYRLLVFGAILVIMMQFKPSGLIPKKRKVYTIQEKL